MTVQRDTGHNGVGSFSFLWTLAQLMGCRKLASYGAETRGLQEVN